MRHLGFAPKDSFTRLPRRICTFLGDNLEGQVNPKSALQLSMWKSLQRGKGLGEAFEGCSQHDHCPTHSRVQPCDCPCTSFSVTARFVAEANSGFEVTEHLRLLKHRLYEPFGFNLASRATAEPESQGYAAGMWWHLFLCGWFRSQMKSLEGNHSGVPWSPL